MGLDALHEYGKRDDAWADLYAVYDFMFESGIENELSEPPSYYFHRVEQGFSRPSFLLKYVSLRPLPKNHYMQWYEGSMQLSFFCDDVFDATLMLHKLQRILTPVRDLILPKYDWTQETPQKISVTGVTPDGERVPALMGARIMPDTVNGTTLQEPDERWQAIVNFTMHSPRLEEFECNPLQQVTLEYLGRPIPNLYPPRILEAGASSETTQETTE
jgi:hypothetical protein